MILSMTQLPLLFFPPFEEGQSLSNLQKVRWLSSIKSCHLYLECSENCLYRHSLVISTNMQGSGIYLQCQSKLKEKTERWSKKKNKRWKIIFKTVCDMAWFNNVNDLQEFHEHLYFDSYRRITVFWL